MPRGLSVLLTAAVLAAASGACASSRHETGPPAPTRTVSPVTPSTAAPPTGQPPSTSAPAPSEPHTTAAGTGIAGQTVMITCPVDRVDPPCPPTPVQARLTVLNATAQSV